MYQVIHTLWKGVNEKYRVRGEKNLHRESECNQTGDIIHRFAHSVFYGVSID